jgi:thiol-disulfide isomerase/thioredoxin
MPMERSRRAAERGTATSRLRAAAALAVLVVLAVALASCSRDARQAASAPADSGSARATADTVAAVDTSAVELVAIDGPGVMKAVRGSGSPVALVNVWATWCVPCREEFPDLMRVTRERREKGLAVVLVSADFEDQAGSAKRFLARHGAGFKSYLKTGDDMAFINTLSPKWSGSLPATFLFDRTGHLIDFWEGRAPYDDISRRVDHALDVAHATLPS